MLNRIVKPYIVKRCIHASQNAVKLPKPTMEELLREQTEHLKSISDSLKSCEHKLHYIANKTDSQLNDLNSNVCWLLVGLSVYFPISIILH